MKAGSVDDMKSASAEAANLMRALAHESRLLVLCALCDREYAVGDLVKITGLSPSALSQHLAKLRADGFVATRRESQTIFYSLADPAVRSVMRALYRTYCPV
jgi:DNA-binding transcriptional ArsR family regulator